VLPLLLLILSSTLLATDKDNFKITSNSKSHIDLQFNLSEWNLETKTENGIEYKSVKSNVKNNLYIDEISTLPIYSAMIAIPDGMDVELITDVTSSENVRSVNLLNKDMINAEKGPNDLYPTRQIVISEPGQFRDFRVVNVNVYPFQYDTKSNDLKVIQTVDVSLRFIPSRDSYRNPLVGHYSMAFDNLYSALILNYDNFRDESVPTEQPVLLIIYPIGGDATFTTKLDELVRWKKQKGYLVYVASTAVGEAGSSTTTIKDYIQNAYDNWQDRPDVVLIIGDPTTGLIAPSYSTQYGDFPYTQLTGGDEYGDIQFGRISVENSSQFSIYVNKIMWYEKNINPSTATWLNKMLLVGDSAHSGISTYYTNYYIHEISHPINPDYTYTELYGSYGSGMQSTFDNAINLGVGFFNYRGYIGMSSWSPNATTTINGVKLNHGVFVTCSTGTFYSGTSATESYTRLGSDALPAGGITAIGMATSSTHTAVNNFLSSAVFDGIFNRNMRSMGEAQMFSRNYLQNVFGVSNPTNAYNFKRYFNLIGDPTVEVFVTVPKTFNVTCPTTLIAETPSLEIIVKDANNVPVADATVNLWQTVSNLNTTAYTNSSGKALFNGLSALTGSVTVTVSKHDFKPNIQNIDVTGTGLIYNSSIIDDDMSGLSIGNSNGIINAGETIEYKIRVKNTTTSTVSSIAGTLTCSDPNVQLITNSFSFLSAGAGAVVTALSAVRFSVSQNCPDNHPVMFYINGTSSAGTWTATIQHIVRSPDLDYVSNTVTGSNSYLEIGETAPIYINVINNGTEQASAVYGILRSFSIYASVTDSLKYFGNIASGNSFSNSANPFSIYAKTTAIVGMKIPFELYLYNSSGYNDTETFILTIGTPTMTDPLGQDTYGYYIFDSGDTDYIQCPTYNWIEIAAALGGPGSLLTINDPRNSGDEGDQIGTDSSELVNLPFTFRYYGVDYNQITVVSNGFMAFGTTSNHDWRNGRIPGAMGPNAMIAPFWDDLTTDGGGGIYVYNDAINNRFIIEWNNMKNGYDGTSEETFQVILYNQNYYPTVSGDGQIKIQYKVFNNVDLNSTVYNHGNGCTVGIKDHTGTDGLEYTYNNSYPPSAQSLSNQKVLFITTAPISPNEPYLWITNTTLMDTNGNGIAEPNETLDIRLTVSNWGNTSATNVVATISESDPWISITNNSANFGTIGGLGSAINTSGLVINVLSGYPDNYTATINTIITCNGYSFNRTFTIALRAPVLTFGTIVIQDPTGNNNGSLDPGETVTALMPLYNNGGAASIAGNSILSSATPGITINAPTTVNFSSIAAGGNINLSFSVTASPSMSIGSLASLVFNATAGSYSAYKDQPVEIGAPHEILIGSGTVQQTYPLDRYYNYSVHESIYLASELETASTIKSIAFYKSSGADLNPIEAVTIYMKNTTESVLSTGVYSTTGYTQVYSGSFPNNATSGWMEVNLDAMFDYVGVTNLSILIVKGYQQWISSYPYWMYSTTATPRARQERNDTATPTTLSASSNLPNIQLKVFPVAGVLYPPQNFTASASNLSVKLDWGVPVTGTPTGYKIFKNSALLTSVTALTYTDLAVTNGTLYSYYLKAVYTGGESDPTSTVNATPNAIAPTNLSAVPGNSIINLSWNAATGREVVGHKDTNERIISQYRIYRNGNPLTTTSGLTYQDTGLTNGVTYTYYVTTIYINPAGESSASNSVQAIPNLVSYSTIGTGSSMTTTGTSSPINILYRSIHGQSVYTVAELNAAGIIGPVLITQLGFYVNSLPTYALPNYLIRMKHTTDTNVLNWQTATNMVIVYNNPSYMPVAGGFEMLSFSTPFQWNGIDNIVVDTAFGLVPEWTSSGTVQYTSVSYGFRSARSDESDQTDVFTGTHTSSYRPNIKLAYQPISLSAPEVSIEKVTQGIRLFWTAVDGATRYIVYGSSEPDDGFTQITEITATEYIDISSNPFHFYRVMAADDALAARNN